MTEFEAVSIRPGRVLYRDLPAGVGAGNGVLVHAFTHTGAPTVVRLELTECWGGAGHWRGMFSCPWCGRPARVLGVTAAGARCGRCSPLRTRHQAEKNTRSWSSEGLDLVDRLQREMEQRGAGIPSRKFMATARALRRLSTRRLQHAMELTTAAVRADGRQADGLAHLDVAEEPESEHEIELARRFRPFESCFGGPPVD